MKRKKPKRKIQGIGLGYLFKLTILISVLMIGNGYLVKQVVAANIKNIPEFFNDVRLYQFFMFFASIGMVSLQFWMYDRWKDRRLSR